jgi:hypothetical protein
MQKTYRVEMDDGIYFDFPADSAAHAIGKALYEHKGHRVVSCRVGQPQLEHKWKHQEAFTYFDIPPHDPITADKPKRKRPDSTTDMFAAGEIEAESEHAKAKTEHGAL